MAFRLKNVGGATGGGSAIPKGLAATFGQHYRFDTSLSSDIVRDALFGIPVSGAVNVVPVDLVAGAPVVGAATVGQTHAVTAANLVAGAPVVGAATVGQTHAVTAANLVAGAPVVGQPALGGTVNVVPVDLVAGAPILTLVTVNGQPIGMNAVRAEYLGSAAENERETPRGMDRMSPLVSQRVLPVGDQRCVAQAVGVHRHRIAGGARR
jgi:hypothetical protein